MFGTLTTTEANRGSLEFVENPDPVAAVNRNLQDKIHVACKLCRHKKVRCTGGPRRCQRCVALGLECVYPGRQGWSRRPREEKIRHRSRASSHFDSHDFEPMDTTSGEISQKETDARASSSRSTPFARSSQEPYGEDLYLDDFLAISPNDTSNDGFMLESWTANNPAQNNTSCKSDSSRSSISTKSFGTMVTPPNTLPELSTTDPFLTSLLSASATNDAEDTVAWGGQQASVSPMSHPWDTERRDTASCSCLVKLITFLEKLVSSSASRQNRIDILLTDFRNSIETLATFMACKNCGTRVERNLLLAMAARHMSVICKKTANSYKTMHQWAHGQKGFPQQESGSDPPFNLFDILVSTYRVNRRESLHLLKSLLCLQIVDFQNQVSTLKSQYRNPPNEGQAEAFRDVENHIRLAQSALDECS